MLKECRGKLCKGKLRKLENFGSIPNVCKKCHTHNMKEYYRKNGMSFRKTKNLLKEGKTCNDCGCKDVRFLEFDHLGDKKFNIGKLQSSKRIKEEAKNTQILCIWCHRLKSHKERQLSYKTYEYTESEENEIIGKDSKKCPGILCKNKYRNADKFYLRGGKKPKGRCKKCFAFECQMVRHRNNDFVLSKKIEASKCIDCDRGVTVETGCCFDFDHKDRMNKKDTIANIAKRTSYQEINLTVEIEKCQLLCCYCHRLKTIKQLGHNKRFFINEDIQDSQIKN